MFSLKDKVALITGASQGIGRATSIILAQTGAKVGVAARNTEKLASLVSEIESAGGEALGQGLAPGQRKARDAGFGEKRCRRHGSEQAEISPKTSSSSVRRIKPGRQICKVGPDRRIAAQDLGNFS